MFDAIVEGLSFLVLVKEHKDAVIRAVKESAVTADGVAPELDGGPACLCKARVGRI
jgi:hypothetical protein